MCNCSYLGSPCAAERALPARPRYEYAQVSQPCCGVAHVSTASPRDEVALSSRGVRSSAHPSSARCLGVPRAHLPARGACAGGFEARSASCSPEVAQLAPRKESATSSRGDAVETCATPPRGRETCATPQRCRAGIARSAAQGEPK